MVINLNDYVQFNYFYPLNNEFKFKNKQIKP